MIDNGRITSYFRNGLAYLSIPQINNKDNNFTIVLPIFVREFYSIFIEKTHAIIDMEIGKECYLKLLYNIIMGFYSVKNLKECL